MDKIHFPGTLNQFFILLTFVIITLVYFSFLPVSYSFDGTVFSHFLRYALLKHNWLAVTQIHHLLYFPANYLIYHVLEVVFNYRVLEFFHLQLFSMFFGIMTLVLVERSLKKLDMTLLLRLLGVMLVAFSYAFWLYSVDAEVHIPGIFFIFAGLYLLVFKETKKYSIILAALCFVLAAGFHLTNGLIAVTVCFYLLSQRALWPRYAQFYLAYLSFMLMLYGVYTAISHKPVLRIIYNVFFGSDIYSGYHSNFFKSFSLQTLVLSFASIKNALVIKAGIWSWLVFAVFLALLAMACQRTSPSIKRTFQRTMLFWFIPFSLFFTFFDTANIEFKIHTLVPLLLIAVTALSRLKPLIACTIGVSLVSGLLLVNLIFGIMPMGDIRQNTNYQVAIAIQKATPANAQILITGNFIGYGYGKIYIPYFAMREVLILDWILGKGHSFPDIHATLKKQAASGRPVYALAEIAEMGSAMKYLLNLHHIQEKEYFHFKSGIEFIHESNLPGGYRLYHLKFKSP
jgi:hypothetical protein